MSLKKRDHLGGLLLIVVITSILSFLIVELCEPDLWWHIAIGNDIINSLKVPNLDHYSIAGFDRAYHDSHWLFQVIIALAHRSMGMVGVEAAMVTIWSMAFFFCYRTMRRDTSLVSASLLLFLVAMTSAMRFLPRPEIVTFLMIPFFYFLLKETKYRTLPHLALFFILQAIWANSHGLFIIGPFMAGCYLIAALIAAQRGGSSDSRPLAILTVGLLGATLITPFGLSGWKYSLLLFREAVPSSSVTLDVGELGATFSKLSMMAPAFWFFVFLLALTLAVIVSAAVKRTASPARLLIVIGLGLAALTGRRNMPLFALVAGPFLAEHLYFSLPLRWVRPVVAGTAVFISAWCWFPLSGQYYRLLFTPARFGLGGSPSYFPYDLPLFLRKTGFRGNIFNSSGLGGFILYNCYPDLLPLTDGRWEIYDQRTLGLIKTAPFNRDVWQKIVTTYDIRGIVLDHTSVEAKGLLPNLVTTPTWRLVYLDNAASFWMRSDVAGVIPAIDLTNPASLPPLSARVDDARILDIFLNNVGSDNLRLTNLERILSLGWREADTMEQIGFLQEKLGDWPGAEKTFARLAGICPKNVAILNELAFLNFRRGNSAGADSFLRRALEVEPGNKTSMEILRGMKQMSRPAP